MSHPAKFSAALRYFPGAPDMSHPTKFSAALRYLPGATT
jgi:rRNA maturation protein Nop10